MIVVNWYKEVVLKKYAEFSGRAGKAEFWYFVLGNFVVSFVLALIFNKFAAWITYLYSLAVLVPGIAVSVRRLHDIGKSGWNLLWGLVPFVGIILLIIWYVKDGQPEANDYGEVPSDTPEETSGNTDSTTPPPPTDSNDNVQ